jgi:hypothetical protein
MPIRRWAQPCTSPTTDGGVCHAWAIRGGNVCRIHGGAAPQVRAMAEFRLLVDRAWSSRAMRQALAQLAATAADPEALRQAGIAALRERQRGSVRL